MCHSSPWPLFWPKMYRGVNDWGGLPGIESEFSLLCQSLDAEPVENRVSSWRANGGTACWGGGGKDFMSETAPKSSAHSHTTERWQSITQNLGERFVPKKPSKSAQSNSMMYLCLNANMQNRWTMKTSPPHTMTSNCNALLSFLRKAMKVASCKHASSPN